MYELKDYQSILREKAGRVEEIFSKYPDESSTSAKKFSELNDTKIKTVEPEIMVYGIYNAGKSSILNELMGEDRAEVNDVPTTDKVDYYDWQGYKIADTPGVLAPIEHENVTQEHLKKADVVLFVMSTTGSNEKIENYQRMKSIADAGKKIIIVLNDKNGDMGENDENLQIIKRQVAVNMKKVGIENVDEKYCIVTVNAEMARTGRLGKKNLLLSSSGIDELKNVILTELKNTSSFKILRNGIKEIENILEEFIKNLERGENSEMLKKMNEVLETFSKQKIQIRKDMNFFIDRETDNLGANLPQIIWDNRQNQDGINEIVGKELEKLNDKVRQEIQHKLEEVASILKMQLESFAEIKIDSQNVEYESFKNILGQLSKIDSQNTQEIVAETSETSKGLDPAEMGLAGGLIAESGKEIAKHLVKTEFGKMIAKTTFGKILGSVVPVIGPILTIVSVVSLLGNLLGGGNDREKVEAKLQAQNEAERQRVEAEMQARQELNQKCRYFANNIADDLKAATDNSIKDILAKYEEPFKNEIENMKTESNELNADILKLREVYNEYDLLAVELGAR